MSTGAPPWCSTPRRWRSWRFSRATAPTGSAREGTTSDPGTFLATISGSSPTTLRHPGVLEVPRGAPLRSLLVAAGTELDRVEAVLVGGYHGAWIPGSHLETRMTSDELSRYGATPGAGVVHVLDRAECPLAVSARIATYLAGESARQCGPCVNGLPRMASTLRALAVPGARGHLVADLDRLRALVNGRGACAHPDGTVRFVGSTMTVFADHVEEHLGGECRARARRLDPL